jgi:uncharacterized protein YbjT (DUF2867 family)
VRIFLAGASGVIGQLLIPMLVADGHTVGGLTRSPHKVPLLRALGAYPIVCDVFDSEALTASVVAFQPDLVLHELTNLPDDPRDIQAGASLNARMRLEGTHNLIAAAQQGGVGRIIAQSVAWPMPPGPSADAVAALESSVLAADGTVLRYGQFYGPGTYYEREPPSSPRVHLDEAARRTVAALDCPPGVIDILD